MVVKRKWSILILVIGMLLTQGLSTSVLASGTGALLRMEMETPDVMKLQQNLHTLGYFHVNPTGYFGPITEASVIEFQESNGLTPDGIAGPQTLGRITHLLTTNPSQVPDTVTRGIARQKTDSVRTSIEMIPWFGEAEHVFAIGDVAVVTDVATGLEAQVKRTYGHNHADVEALTAHDTHILLEMAGGEWNWIRRPVIVQVHGRRLAASITLRPHAGRDDMPTNQVVSSRSGGFGRGMNLNAVHGNGMDGHIDIHFEGSRTHGSNQVDADHQQAIRQAYESGK